MKSNSFEVYNKMREHFLHHNYRVIPSVDPRRSVVQLFEQENDCVVIETYPKWIEKASIWDTQIPSYYLIPNDGNVERLEKRVRGRRWVYENSGVKDSFKAITKDLDDRIQAARNRLNNSMVGKYDADRKTR